MPVAGDEGHHIVFERNQVIKLHRVPLSQKTDREEGGFGDERWESALRIGCYTSRLSP